MSGDYLKIIRTCDECGQEFERVNNNQRYCSAECKANMQKKRMAIYAETQKKRNAEKKIKEKMNKMPALIDISAEARKAGMSYGKYE